MQPYLPSYRVPLFMGVTRRLEQVGIELTVAHGAVGPESSSRGDSELVDWATPLKTRRISMLGRSLVWRDIARAGPHDLLIVEQALGNADSYKSLLLQRKRGHPRVALWGHGKSYAVHRGAVSAALLRRVTNLAHWFFAYTEAGASFVVRGGFPGDRVTILNNTVDTQALARAQGQTTAEDLSAFRDSYGLGGKTALAFIGGLDPTKSPEFLLESFRHMLGQRPDLVLLVAGEGRDRHKFQNSGMPVRLLGRIGPHEKALLAGVAALLLVPSAVGLVAVDSMALGVPLVATSMRGHGPEFDYLLAEGIAVIAPSTPSGFAQRVLALLRNEPERSGLAQRCRESVPRYSLEATIERFAVGVQEALGAEPRP